MSETVLPHPPARLLPWHEQAAAQLRQAWAAGRLPHALLLQGAEGLGRRPLASWLACAVLCETSGAGKLECCGQCASCTLHKAGSHPDLLWVAPEEDKQQISVDQVRATTERLGKTSYRGGYKVAIVEPAHQMTPSAANSLLKTLEEPPAQSLLVLITSKPSALLPTVRSRCQRVAVHRPSRGEALAWLRQESGREIDAGLLDFAGGAPLRALEYAGGRFEMLDEQMRGSLSALFAGQADVTQVAAEWSKDALIERLRWLDFWLTSAARATLAGNDDRVTLPGGPVHLPSLPRPLNISGLYSMVDRARALQAQLSRTALQRELAVESWLIALADLLAPAAASGAGGTGVRTR